MKLYLVLGALVAAFLASILLIDAPNSGNGLHNFTRTKMGAQSSVQAQIAPKTLAAAPQSNLSKVD